MHTLVLSLTVLTIASAQTPGSQPSTQTGDLSSPGTIEAQVRPDYEDSQDYIPSIGTPEYSQSYAPNVGSPDYSQNYAPGAGTSYFSQSYAPGVGTRDYSQNYGPGGGSPYYSQNYASRLGTPYYSQNYAPGPGTPYYSQNYAPGPSTPYYSQNYLPAVRTPYYGQNYPSTYSNPGGVPFPPNANFPSPLLGNAYSAFSGQSFLPRSFGVGTNNFLQKNPYSSYFNPGPFSGPGVSSIGPNFPPSQYDNYAPTYTTPFQSPLPDLGRPFYPPPPGLLASESPNVIKEEPDGKHFLRGEDSVLVNRTFIPMISSQVTPEFNYKQIVVPDIAPGRNPNINYNGDYEGNLLHTYPLTNFSEPYNPDLRPILKPETLDNNPSINFPSPLPSSEYPSELSSSVPISKNTFDINSRLPSPYIPNFQTRLPDYSNQVDQGTIFSSTHSPVFPSALPDITLSGSSRYTENRYYLDKTSRRVRPPTPSRSQVVYDAPGHSVAA